MATNQATDENNLQFGCSIHRAFIFLLRTALSQDNKNQYNGIYCFRFSYLSLSLSGESKSGGHLTITPKI